MLQGYKDKKDFKPTMFAEVRRAGRISMRGKGFGEWPVKSQEEGGVSEGSWDSTAAPTVPQGASRCRSPTVPPTGQHLGLTFSACLVSEGAPEFSERRGTAGSKREDRLWAAIALVLC